MGIALHKKKTSHSTLMTEGSIWKHILFFSIPLILGNMLQQLYNTVDSIVVGNFLGSEALAAVGSSSSLIMLLISFSMGAAAGAGVIVSQFIGAQNKKGIHESVHTALAIALILGVVLTAAGLILSPQILRWMGTPEEVMPQSITYLRLYFAGVIFSILYNMASGILNAVGNSKRALLYLAIASFTNIILDLLFIPVLKMGIAGAAIATDISQLLSAVLCMLYLMRVNESYKVVLRKIRIHKTVAIRIIQVGVPTAIQNTVISFANVLVQASVNSYGALAMAGFAAYIKIDGFNILPVMSFSMAATTFSGQNYGAGNMERVRKGMRVTVAMGVIYCICVGSILLLFAHPLIGIFSKDPTVIEFGVRAMLYFCPFYFLLAIMHGLAGAIRGIGKSVPPMVIILFSLCVYRVIWIRLAVAHIPTIDGVYMVYPISWLIGAILMIVYTKTAFPKQASTQNISL